MIIEETEARAIAGRWGKVMELRPLIVFAETGLVADRKRFKEAIGSVRLFLKDAEEMDQLEAFVDSPGPCEIAARREGWRVADNQICHVHDHDRRISYRSWRACCDGEDINVEE